MTDNGRDPDQVPEGINPDAWRVACTAPRPTPEQLACLSAVVARWRAGHSDTTKAG